MWKWTCSYNTSYMVVIIIFKPFNFKTSLEAKCNEFPFKSIELSVKIRIVLFIRFTCPFYPFYMSFLSILSIYVLFIRFTCPFYPFYVSFLSFLSGPFIHLYVLCADEYLKLNCFHDCYEDNNPTLALIDRNSLSLQNVCCSD